MAAGYQDQYIEQGTTFNSQITLDDSNGTPYDLTGFTIKSQARRSYYSANASINFTVTIPDAHNGIVTLSAPATDTANVASGKYVYDVIITETASGLVTRVLEGQIFVSPCATR
jgi:hypothetical protein